MPAKKSSSKCFYPGAGWDTETPNRFDFSLVVALDRLPVVPHYLPEEQGYVAGGAAFYECVTAGAAKACLTPRSAKTDPVWLFDKEDGRAMKYYHSTSVEAMPAEALEDVRQCDALIISGMAPGKFGWDGIISLMPLLTTVLIDTETVVDKYELREAIRKHRDGYVTISYFESECPRCHNFVEVALVDEPQSDDDDESCTCAECGGRH